MHHLHLILNHFTLGAYLEELAIAGIDQFPVFQEPGLMSWKENPMTHGTPHFRMINIIYFISILLIIF